VKKKFDIIKSFEIFNSEALSVIKDKIIEIVLIEAENIFSKHPAVNNSLFNVDIKKDNSFQVTVFNDKKTYDLLSNTWKRQKLRKQKAKNEENTKPALSDKLYKA